MTRSMRVEADAEAVLHELADGAQAAVAEVLVLVELGAMSSRRVPIRFMAGVGVVLGVVGHAELGRQGDEPPDELDDVLLVSTRTSASGRSAGAMWPCRRELSLWRPTRERS